MSIISEEEYLKLKKTNETYLILGIVFLIIAGPVGVIFLILMIQNNQKIKEYELNRGGNQPAQAYTSPVQPAPAYTSPVQPTPAYTAPEVATTMSKTCNYCNTILDVESINTLNEKGSVFCTNCGNRIEL